MPFDLFILAFARKMSLKQLVSDYDDEVPSAKNIELTIPFIA